ncbi:hypothetical protein KFL_000580110 [Klebsormidium nitens]|uniref:Uncharacterized protein n=1 Tax=Klebsormidium nitens TaxID=105231 RepID=A0A1Y1HVQ4_KLENI|nr:hypothetical protein KFL_000580110 [Klebsormidium nitens]|eukprot:GAQ80617.1 hypothetical protein KFL_000580110 [Klebsormidium nitens]
MRPLIQSSKHCSNSEKFWNYELRRWLCSWPLLVTLAGIHAFILTLVSEEYRNRIDIESFCPQLFAAKAIYADYLDELPDNFAFGGYGLKEIFLILPGRWILSGATLFGLTLFLCEIPCFIVFIFADWWRAVTSAPVSIQATTHSLPGDTSRTMLASEDFWNMSLPDPDVINAYLRSNTSLRNSLLPGTPPLQLIKCHVYLMQTGNLFNFYTADHPGGCEEAPRTALKPMSSYSASEIFWTLTFPRWLCFWPFLLALGFVHFVLLSRLNETYERRKRSGVLTAAEEKAAGFFFVAAFALLYGSLFGGFIFAVGWTDTEELYPQLLPDPASNINSIFQTSNVSLNLHVCNATSPLTGRDVTLFQFYTGMPQSFCSQLLEAKAVYGDFLDHLPDEVRFDYTTGPAFFPIVGRSVILAAAIYGWALLVIEAIYVIAITLNQRSNVSEREVEAVLAQELDMVEQLFGDHKQDADLP